MWNKSLEKVKNRELWLDIAKAFCIILVVLNHLNVHIPIITFFGGMIYMPLFFVAAGYTYRRKEGNFKDFAIGKAKRLLIPYFICNILLFGFFTLLNGFSKPNLLGIFYSRSMLMAADSVWNMALMSNLNAPTWFLTCLFLCYCFYYLIEGKFKDTVQRRKVIAAAVVLGVLLRTFSPALLPWSLENALYFLGLIEFGRFLKEEGLAWLRAHEWIYANLLIAFVALSYMHGSVNVSISQYGKSMVLYFLTAAIGSVLCMKAGELTEKYLKLLAKPLSFLGRHTLPILCWHLLAIEIVRFILLRLNVSLL